MNNKKVAIYTTPSCVYCKMTKDWFKENGVKYDEYNVGTDLARRQEMVDKSGQMGVPVIAIGEGEDEQIIIGFDKTGLNNALKN
jgi:glutaredoxin-like YruB-family protein